MKTFLKVVGLLFLIAFLYNAFTENKEENKVVINKDKPIECNDKIDVFFDINTIFNKPLSVVNKYLGKPISIKVTNDCSDLPSPCKEYKYRDGSITVLFKKGKSWYIEFSNMESFSFCEEMRKYFKLDYTTPKILMNGTVYWYENYKDIRKACFIESEAIKGKINYVIFEGY